MAVWVQWEDISVGTRLVWRLPFFLKRPITLRQAGEELLHRLAERQDNFLSLVRHAIYENPGSPYLTLLRTIGCEAGDLRKLVQQEGVEGALEELFRGGLYLTIDEFKGSKPIIRGSTTFYAEPAAFVNPATTFHMAHRTSGSRGPAALVPVDLASLRDRAVNTLLGLDARGACDWSHAIWVVPGGSGLSPLLQYAALGIRTRRWFSQVDPNAPQVHPRYNWSIRALRFGGFVGGVSFPAPSYAPLHDPQAIFVWLADIRKKDRTPHLQTFPSSAVQLSELALAKGLELDGVQFSIVGEPITEARLAKIRLAGASAVPHYGTAESGRIGDGCLAPEFADECHLFEDLNAVIQPGLQTQNSGLPARALLVSSLRPTSPLVLVNVSMGDQGVIRSRACGCPLAQRGWTRQLHTIRSFEKLTAGGMTFVDSDLIGILEKSLPARFGGLPADYQLVETEDVTGNPRLELWVSPQLGEIDAHAVKRFFFASLGRDSEAQAITARFWRDAELLEVVRRTPRATPGGKILHIHVVRRSGPEEFHGCSGLGGSNEKQS